jgi:hypothetical protein
VVTNSALIDFSPLLANSCIRQQGGNFFEFPRNFLCIRERIYAMTLTTLNQKEEEILSFDVSDEALESAAGTEISANYTLGSCTGLSVCPAW